MSSRQSLQSSNISRKPIRLTAKQTAHALKQQRAAQLAIQRMQKMRFPFPQLAKGLHALTPGTPGVGGLMLPAIFLNMYSNMI